MDPLKSLKWAPHVDYILFFYLYADYFPESHIPLTIPVRNCYRKPGVKPLSHRGIDQRKRRIQRNRNWNVEIIKAEIDNPRKGSLERLKRRWPWNGCLCYGELRAWKTWPEFPSIALQKSIKGGDFEGRGSGPHTFQPNLN